MDTLDTKISQKNASENFKYFCYGCSFGTMNKTDYTRHCSTKKHTMDTLDAKKTQSVSDIKEFICECGSAYKYSQGLSKHRKTCEKKEVVATPITDVSNNPLVQCEFLMDLFKEMLKTQNEQMIEIFKNGVGNTTNTNCHNKTKFNMNFFLNEQCKDAMNIMDFVNTMQLQLSDLERVGEHGYVKGISHIIVNKLKDLEICKRPIHCSDLKRETMYVKDENVWEKENEKKGKLSKMITHVAHKNQKQIGSWQEENPEYKDSESMKCDELLKIVRESMNGLTNDDESDGYTNKIIKNIAKEVIIKEESIL